MDLNNDPVLRKWRADPEKNRKLHVMITFGLISAMVGLTLGGIVLILIAAGII